MLEKHFLRVKSTYSSFTMKTQPGNDMESMPHGIMGIVLLEKQNFRERR